MDLRFFLILFFLPALLVALEFFFFLFTCRRFINNFLFLLAEIVVLLVMPYMYAGFGMPNNCCADAVDTAAFSPQHQLTIGVFIILCLGSYFYCRFRKKILPPVPEIFVNVFILMGTILCIFIGFHTGAFIYTALGILPILFLGVLMLVKNQQLLLASVDSDTFETDSIIIRLATKILLAKWFIKFPILLVLCLPIVVLTSWILLLFGQKPDSVIRAFTDTYKHGFSQWDYKCENVQCGGHYLCSVAANGHKTIVKPIRYGKRGGNLIICNRQLLVSNAFEELLEEKFPLLHKHIRHRYNKVGSFIHRFYFVFNNKLLSDFIYLAMKPAEILFLIVLYCFDYKPENRIAKQYLGNKIKRFN